MKIAPQSPNEAGRLAALQRYGVLDTPSDSVLDNITQLAADVCGTPIALISLIDSRRQWFKSRVGLAVQETSRDLAFCAHAILEPDELMEIEDATLDERFHDNPLVIGGPMMRFYAGKPLVTRDGFALGTICVLDQKSSQLSPSQQSALHRLAQVVVDLFDERMESRKSANDDVVGQMVQQGVLVANQNQMSSNEPTLESNTSENSKRENSKRGSRFLLHGKQHSAVDTLACIIYSAVEYDLDIEPTRFLNLIDFYCSYLRSARGSRMPFKNRGLDHSAGPATFLQFISDQTLLNDTALFIAFESGEKMVAPKALDKQIG